MSASRYMTTRTLTRPMIWPEAAAQSPLCQLASITAMTFCMNTEGMELMMALNRMQHTTTGIMTG